MSSTNVFSFYDAAEVAQEEAKIIVNTEYVHSMDESEVDDVRDEADAIEGEEEGERVDDTTCTEPANNSESGGVNQWLDRANALSEIRMLLKEEIEQDSGEYCTCYMHALSQPLSLYTNTAPPYPFYIQKCFLSSMT